MIADAAKVLHQSIELLKRGAAISLSAFSDQAEFLKDRDGVIEFLPGEGISPRRCCNGEDVRQMREIVAASLRLDILREFLRE